MSVITVTRQYGAGGSRVADLVARALDWTLIDNAFVEAIAARAGLPAETVAAQEERAPSLKERLMSALATSSPEVFVPTGEPTDDLRNEERIVRVTERIIGDAARHGRVVLVGRGAQAILATGTSDQSFHVYVVAPREVRIQTIQQRLALDEKEAATRTDETDANRDRYVEKWHSRRRQDPSNYHLVVNTGWLGYEGAARLIVASVAQRGWT